MSRYVVTIVLLALLGAVLLVLTMPRVAHAQPERSCSIPKSAGSYRGGIGLSLVFESAGGTLTLYDGKCNQQGTITRN